MSGRSGFLGKENAPRVYYNKEEEKWYLFSNVALNKTQIQICVNYAKGALKKNIDNSQGVNRIKLQAMFNKLNSDTITNFILPNEYNESYLIKKK